MEQSHFSAICCKTAYYSTLSLRQPAWVKTNTDSELQMSHSISSSTVVTGLPITFTFHYQLYVVLRSNHTHTSDSHIGQTKKKIKKWYTALCRPETKSNKNIKLSRTCAKGILFDISEKLLAQTHSLILITKSYMVTVCK